MEQEERIKNFLSEIKDSNAPAEEKAQQIFAFKEAFINPYTNLNGNKDLLELYRLIDAYQIQAKQELYKRRYGTDHKTKN